MTTLINNWFKQIFIHHALSNKKNFLNNTITEQCTIVDKPSTMSDVDIINCNINDENKNSNFSLKKPIEMKTLKKDTIVIDKFQACFIDCKCQCEARKVIPQINTNECQNLKNQLIEELFQQIRRPSYEIDCCCDCGKKGIRKLKFNYITGDKITNCF